ncbi:hypothetical protein PLESTB_000724600 [Pleodorina starrii]|uniref:RRM domain-containing protein n=1 Tax=Pleodorina starrii TaxID=330485 RepID=A0A9W6F2D2_9CHLO|nr:hypothetical protein PLESTM_001702500 [Pleodorina starrii]GLC53250.1 hypothetical protein PLESTB_000724600 [Pleodorina starrii]GLC68115.1 hypothetical protein PLESTF_000647600 [Pleodorina starrii]
MAEEPANEHGFTEVPEQQPPPQPKSSVLRLRGLPFSAGEEDVRHFFSGFNVAQVVIGKRAGRSTGEGYVQLDSTAAAAEAIMKLHRQTLGHRYIEVFESTEADLATAKSLSVDRMRGFVVRCRGLPYTATAQDVLNFFGPDVPVVRGIEGVVFTYAPDGRPTGEAFVEFQTEDAQREALKKHKESMGARYIELFVSTKVDMIQAIQQNRLILGYSNRKRWLQQQGINLGPGPAPGHMHPHMQPHHHQNHYGPQQQNHGPRRHPQYGQVEEVTEMMSGFNMGGMGGHAVQVIGPGGQMLPPGTYQLEVPREGGGGKQQQQRFGFPGRGGGRGGARGPGPAAFPGRGPAGGMVMGGRGMQQFAPSRPPPQVVAMAPMPPAARQTAQVVPVAAAGQAGNGGQAVMMQEIPQQAGAPYIQYEQQQWSQQVMVQQQQQGNAQQQSPLYTAGANAQQATAIQGVAPGTYTLTNVIQVPTAAGGAGGGYTDYQQQVHSLQGLDGSAGAGGLQSTWGPR